LFLKKGFDSTTLDEIAAACDVSKGTLLRYFGTKEEIAFGKNVAVCDAFVEGLKAREGSVIDHWSAFVDEKAPLNAGSDDLRTWHEFVVSDPRLAAFELRIIQRYQQVLAEALSEEAGVDPRDDTFACALSTFLVWANFNVARMTARNGEFHLLPTRLPAVVDLARTLRRGGAPKEARRKRSLVRP
jgi:AcrR family transcriptional regulator